MNVLMKLYEMLEDGDIKHVINPKFQKDDETVKLLVEWVACALMDKLQREDYLKSDGTAIDYWKSLKNKRSARDSLDELITSIMDESDQKAFSFLKDRDKTWKASTYYRSQVRGKDEGSNMKRARLVKALEQIVEMMDEN